MRYRRDMIMLAVLSVAMILMSLLGIVWDFFSGLLFGGLDGILLLAICLMMGGVFTLELLIVGRQAGWVPAFDHGKEAAAKVSPAAPTKAAAVPAAPRSAPVPPAPAAATASAAAPLSPSASPTASTTPTTPPTMTEDTQ